MSMIRYKECVSLSWGKTGAVCGVKVKLGKDGKLGVAAAASAANSATVAFPERLADVFARLHPSEDDLVIVGGDIAGSVCVEFNIPQMPLADIPSAVRFELPRHLPFNLDEIIWGYRLISGLTDAAASYRVRVFAVVDKNWNELVGLIAGSGVKTDAFVHPFMAVDPRLGGQEAYFPSVEPLFCMGLLANDPLRHVMAVEPDQADAKTWSPKRIAEALNLDEGFTAELGETSALDAFPALLAAAYGLDEGFPGDVATLAALPKELVPQRFSSVRTLCVVLAIFAFVFALGYVGRVWWDTKGRIAQVKQEISKVNGLIAAKKNQVVRKKDIEELIDTVGAAEVGNSEILFCLQELSRLIPKDMWVLNFTSADRSMDLTIREAPDAKGTLDRLRRSPYFNVDIRSRQKTADGFAVSAKVDFKSRN